MKRRFPWWLLGAISTGVVVGQWLTHSSGDYQRRLEHARSYCLADIHRKIDDCDRLFPDLEK